MRIIKFFYDIETTGIDPLRHGIHQIAGWLEIDGYIEDSIVLDMVPFDGAIYDPGALTVCKKTVDQIKSNQPMHEAYAKMIKFLSAYIDRYDKYQKAYLVGYNNRSFDDIFFRTWFTHNNDPYFGAWFWPNSLDVMVLATQKLLDIRMEMPNFKLATVARYLDILVDEGLTHGAIYDAQLTREIYKKCIKVS